MLPTIAVCPTSTRTPDPDDITGCGAVFVAYLAPDGWIDCPECGIFFDPTDPANLDYSPCSVETPDPKGCHMQSKVTITITLAGAVSESEAERAMYAALEALRPEGTPTADSDDWIFTLVNSGEASRDRAG